MWPDLISNPGPLTYESGAKSGALPIALHSPADGVGFSRFITLVMFVFHLFPFEFWLVGCFGLNSPLRQYFSLYRAVSQREGERKEMIDEGKNVQTTPIRTHCKRSRPLPYCNPY